MHRMLDGKEINPNQVRKAPNWKVMEPKSWNDPRMIFTCSMSDFFIEQADEWRPEAWQVIKESPQHTWQILTKRPERIAQSLPADWGNGYPNVWFGVTVENQKCMERAWTLAKIPVRVRFISAEPLLEEVDFLEQRYGERAIDYFQWLILGGESGNTYGKWKYREMKIAWLRKAIRDLQTTHVAIHVKQLGTYLAKQHGLKHWCGEDMNEWPKDICIRRYPNLTREQGAMLRAENVIANKKSVDSGYIG